MIDLSEISANRLVTVYSEDLDEKAVYGFIVVYDDSEMILACVDVYGENDGFLLLRRDGIYRIDYGSSYEKKLEVLLSAKHVSHETIPVQNKDCALIDVLLSWAYKNKKTVTLKYGDDLKLCGYIEDLEKCRIRRIDQYFCDAGQGYSYVEPEKADYIQADERRSRDAEKVIRCWENGKSE